MRRWKRILLCVLIAAVLGFGWWAGARRPSPAGLSIVLLGYTNGSALLCATNSGPVPVRVHSLRNIVAYKNDDVRISPASILTVTVSGIAPSASMPLVIEPGGMVTFDNPVPPESRLWAATAMFEGWSSKDRMYAWARSSGNATTRRWAYQLLSEPKYINLTFNSPTNQSPIKVGPEAFGTTR